MEDVTPWGWVGQRDYASWEKMHHHEHENYDLGWNYQTYLKEGAPIICYIKTGGTSSWAPNDPDGYKPSCHGSALGCDWRWEGDPFPSSYTACTFGQEVHNCQPCHRCNDRSIYMIAGLFFCRPCTLVWMHEDIAQLW